MFIAFMTWYQNQPISAYLPDYIKHPFCQLWILFKCTDFPWPRDASVKNIGAEELINYLHRTLYFGQKQNTYRELWFKYLFGLRTLLAFSPSTACTRSCSWFAFLRGAPRLERKHKLAEIKQFSNSDSKRTAVFLHLCILTSKQTFGRCISGTITVTFDLQDIN